MRQLGRGYKEECERGQRDRKKIMEMVKCEWLQPNNCIITFEVLIFPLPSQAFPVYIKRERAKLKQVIQKKVRVKPMASRLSVPLVILLKNSEKINKGRWNNLTFVVML